MTLNHFNRRFHLYLAMALLPWFFVYGISSLAIQHGNLFTFGEKNPPWEQAGEKPYSLDIPEDPDWRAIGAKVLWGQIDVYDDEAAALAEADGLQVVMDRCPKIELFRPFWKPRLDLELNLPEKPGTARSAQVAGSTQ